MASLYSATQQTSSFCYSSGPPRPSAGPPWSASLPHLRAAPGTAPLSACSRAPPWGATVNFSVAEAFAPSALSVCEFSAQLTFTSTADREITVALWDLESGAVTYHQVEGEATPVQRCGGRQHRLMLKRTCALGHAHRTLPTLVGFFFLPFFQGLRTKLVRNFN